MGAALCLVGVVLALPHATGIAAANTGDSGSSSVSAPHERTGADRRAIRAAGANPPNVQDAERPKALNRVPIASSVSVSTVAPSRTLAANPPARVRPGPGLPPALSSSPAASPRNAALRPAASAITITAQPRPAATSITTSAFARPAAVSVPQQTAAQQDSPTPIQRIGSVVNRFLTNTADWLSTLPANPISDFLNGAVYLLRRSLFPTSVGVVSSPIVVPLYLTDIGGGSVQKLGIYATLGSGATPVIFELDTGGPGFYAAYASQAPAASPWWGKGVNTSTVPVSVAYTSGNAYTGYAANAQVSLFAKGGTEPLLTTGRVTVGQMDSIGNGTPLWTPTGLPSGTTTPPIDSAFWGDFGLAPTYKPNGVTDLLSQLTYVNGVLPGYRIHVDSANQQAWLQIGLTTQDIADPAGNYFPMVIDPDAPGYANNPNSGVRYYSEQLFQATITITDPAYGNTIVNTPDIGITPDTGASTAVHWTERSPQPYPTQYASIGDGGRLMDGLRFTVTGTTTAGTRATVLDFTTNKNPNAGKVSVLNSGTPLYYLNTGLLLFLRNDAVYYLGDSTGGGTFGLIPNGV